MAQNDNLEREDRTGVKDKVRPNELKTIDMRVNQ